MISDNVSYICLEWSDTFLMTITFSIVLPSNLHKKQKWSHRPWYLWRISRFALCHYLCAHKRCITISRIESTECALESITRKPMSIATQSLSINVNNGCQDFAEKTKTNISGNSFQVQPLDWAACFRADFTGFCLGYPMCTFSQIDRVYFK